LTLRKIAVSRHI